MGPPPRRPLKVGTKPRQPAKAHSGCTMGDLFRVLGKAHTLDIIYVLMSQPDGKPLRFVDLQKRLQMNPNTLSERLHELVEAGLLSRTAYNEIPPRVDYALTAKARDLAPVFGTLTTWAGKHDLRPLPAVAPSLADAPA